MGFDFVVNESFNFHFGPVRFLLNGFPIRVFLSPFGAFGFLRFGESTSDKHASMSAIKAAFPVVDFSCE